MNARRIILTTCLVLLVATAALAQTDPKTVIASLEPAVNAGTATHDEQLDLARAYITVGRYYEAGKIAKRLVAENANDAAAVSVRDEAQSQLKAIAQQRVTDAEAAARRSEATDADRIELAEAYFAAGSYRMAADQYEKVPMASLSHEQRLHHARALAWSGRNDAAERAYSALMAEGSSPELELEYGRLLSWMGAYGPSIERLRSSSASLRSEEALVALANAYAWSGDRNQAVRLLSDYTAANAGATQAASLLEQIRTSPELRLERTERLIELDPYNLALRVQRARLLYETQRYGEALKTIRFVRENSPRRVDELDELERQVNEARKAKVDELNARLANLNINDAGNAEDVLSLAKSYTGVGEYTQAIRLYDAYLQNVPDDLDARINYARVLSWDRRYDAAQRQYQTVLNAQPDRADIELEYAQALSWDREYVPAIQAFRSLTDISSNPRAHLYEEVPARAHFNLGQIYRWFGWREHAVEEQSRAVSLDTDYFPAQQELTRARLGRPSSEVEGRYTYATNSNDFTLRRADLDVEHWSSPRFAWQGGIGRHSFEYQGDTVDANVARVGALYRRNDVLLFRGNVGGTFYQEDLGTRPFWGTGVEWLPNIQSRASLDYNHYDLIYDVFTLQSLNVPVGGGTFASDPIDIDDFRGHYDYSSGGFWSFLGDASYGLISDDNRRSAAHGLLSFRLLRAPFVAIKADGHILSYDFRTNRYWSPDDYKSLAGVLQIGQNFRDKFFWNVEGKLGKSWENDRSSDLRSIAASVTVPVSDAFDVIGHYGYGRTGRFDSITGADNGDLTTYWQRNWYVGIRLKQLYASDDRRERNPYYYDNRAVTGGSAVIPPEAQ
ncbi:MAG TPA: tetratricopeptide repeat protein [Thermoanaerobaculia bacterium]|nr:tetratricopeptide repeat protein [Thermoanaerobaculia bacterium]